MKAQLAFVAMLILATALATAVAAVVVTVAPYFQHISVGEGATLSILGAVAGVASLVFGQSYYARRVQ